MERHRDNAKHTIMLHNNWFEPRAADMYRYVLWAML